MEQRCRFLRFAVREGKLNEEENQAMKGTFGIVIISCFLLLSGQMFAKDKDTIVEVYGRGGVILYLDGRIQLCPIPSQDICAVITTCGTSGTPQLGDVVRAEMQDGSGKQYEGRWLSIGSGNQGAELDTNQRCGN